MLIPAAFFGIMMLTFGVMALVTNPSQGQKRAERRIMSMRTAAMTATSANNENLGGLLKQEAVSSFGFLDRLFEDMHISRSIELRILQANSKTTVVQLLLTTLGAGFAGFAMCFIFVHVLLVQALVALIAAYIPYGYISFKRSRRIGAFNKALPDAIDMMARSLRAGHSLVASISIVAEQSLEPVRSEFSEVFKQQNFGLPLRDALMQMLDHVPSQDLRVLVTGMLVQKETGGNLAEILDRIVTVIRERLRIHGEIRTHTAQGRMTGWILCMLPVVMLGLINLINPGYSSVLFETPLGHKLLYAGLTLLTLGGLIIRQIVNGIEV